jgi:hypothetical protein
MRWVEMVANVWHWSQTASIEFYLSYSGMHPVSVDVQYSKIYRRVPYNSKQCVAICSLLILFRVPYNNRQCVAICSLLILFRVPYNNRQCVAICSLLFLFFYFFLCLRGRNDRRIARKTGKTETTRKLKLQEKPNDRKSAWQLKPGRPKTATPLKIGATMFPSKDYKDRIMTGFVGSAHVKSRCFFFDALFQLAQGDSMRQ